MGGCAWRADASSVRIKEDSLSACVLDSGMRQCGVLAALRPWLPAPP